MTAGENRCRPRRVLSRIGCAFASVALLVILSGPAVGTTGGATLRVTFLGVNGDATLFQGPCGDLGLLDAPLGRETAVAHIERATGGHKLAWIAVSHYDDDHMGGVAPLLADGYLDLSGFVYDRGPTNTKGAHYRSYEAAADALGSRHKSLASATPFVLCPNDPPVVFDVVYVGSDSTQIDGRRVTNENDKSACLRVTYVAFSMLSCGDLGGDRPGGIDVEGYLVRAGRVGPVDVATVNHHGSRFSMDPAWVSTLAPSAWILSAANHPSQRAAQQHTACRLAEVGRALFSTRTADGALTDVELTTNGTTGFTVSAPGETGPRAFDLKEVSPTSANSSSNIPILTATGGFGCSVKGGSMSPFLGATVGPGWRAGAIAIAIGFLVLLWLLIGVVTHRWNPLSLAQGADGANSTSKFQWLLWLFTVLFAYVALWVIRAAGGGYHAISHIPVNLLAVLGISTVTAAGAKAITVGYVSSGKVAKDATTPAGGIFQDDQGFPDIAKIQMVAFTFIAIGIFLATLIHQISLDPPVTRLPNIDASLLVLMGISQGGYLGKKLVTTNTPAITSVSPAQGNPGDTVTLTGKMFGDAPNGNLVTIDGTPVAVASWSASTVTFVVPDNDPATDDDWGASQDVKVRVVVNGQTTGGASFTVNPPTVQQPDPPSGPPGQLVRIVGANLGNDPGQVKVDGALLTPSSWTSTVVTFTVPERDPGSGLAWQAAQEIRIRLIVGGHLSNKVAFTVTAPNPAPPG